MLQWIFSVEIKLPQSERIGEEIHSPTRKRMIHKEVKGNLLQNQGPRKVGSVGLCQTHTMQVEVKTSRIKQIL
jgi:hypothetical protein